MKAGGWSRITVPPGRNGSMRARTSLWPPADAWGHVRTGADYGLPKARYCANLGHKQDDDTGLFYMRARYYEASTGRFVSEDPAGDARNWYSYCNNEPVNRIDSSGKSWQNIDGGIFAALGMLYAIMAVTTIWLQNPLEKFSSTAYQYELAQLSASWASVCFAVSTICISDFNPLVVSLAGLAIGAYQATIFTMNLGLKSSQYSQASVAAAGYYIYGLLLIGYLTAISVEEMMR